MGGCGIYQGDIIVQVIFLWSQTQINKYTNLSQMQNFQLSIAFYCCYRDEKPFFTSLQLAWVIGAILWHKNNNFRHTLTRGCILSTGRTRDDFFFPLSSAFWASRFAHLSIGCGKVFETRSATCATVWGDEAHNMPSSFTMSVSM